MHSNQVEDVKTTQNINSSKESLDCVSDGIFPAYLCECTLQSSDTPVLRGSEPLEVVGCESRQFRNNSVDNKPPHCNQFNLSKSENDRDTSNEHDDYIEEIDFLECNPKDVDSTEFYEKEFDLPNDNAEEVDDPLETTDLFNSNTKEIDSNVLTVGCDHFNLNLDSELDKTEEPDNSKGSNIYPSECNLNMECYEEETRETDNNNNPPEIDFLECHLNKKSNLGKAKEINFANVTAGDPLKIDLNLEYKKEEKDSILNVESYGTKDASLSCHLPKYDHSNTDQNECVQKHILKATKDKKVESQIENNDLKYCLDENNLWKGGEEKSKLNELEFNGHKDNILDCELNCINQENQEFKSEIPGIEFEKVSEGIVINNTHHDKAEECISAKNITLGKDSVECDPFEKVPSKGLKDEDKCTLAIYLETISSEFNQLHLNASGEYIKSEIKQEYSFNSFERSLSLKPDTEDTKEGLNLNGKLIKELKVVLCRLEDEEIFKLWKENGVIPPLGKKCKEKLGNGIKSKCIKKKKFKCQVCKKLFVSKERYTEHRATKCDRVRVFGCDNCNRKYILKKMLIEHRAKCVLIKNFRCTVCLKLFNSKERLYEHNTSKCDTQKVFNCDVCGRGYVFKRLLFLHRTPICASLRRSKCTVCDKLFRKSELQSHKIREHGIRLVVLCEICGILVSRKHFPEHLKRHSDQFVHKCTDCSKKFKTKDILMKHRENHAHTVNCADCGKSFNSITHLRRHVSGNGTAGTRFLKCTVCGKIFRNSSCFQAHYNSHQKVENQSEDIFKCHIEQKDCYNENVTLHAGEKTSTSDGTTLGLNLESARPSTSKTEHSELHIQVGFKCEKCPKIFERKNYLNRHLRRVHKLQLGDKKVFQTKETPYACDICGNRFSEKKNLARHHRRMHRVSLLDTCKCSENNSKTDFMQKEGIYENLRECFVTSGDVEQGNVLTNFSPKEGEKHIMLNDVNRERKIFQIPEVKDRILHGCNVCGKPYDKKPHLKNDLTVQFQNIHASLLCYKCGETSNSLEIQQQHVCPPKLNSTYNSVKQNLHACEECGKTYSQKWKLKKHLLSHSSESFKCEICRKIFKSQVNLSVHTLVHRVKTTAGSTFQCQTCNKVFSCSSRLKQHLFIHSGESPHKCVKCNKTFTTYFSMKRHMDTVHPDKRFTCNHCNMSFFSCSSLSQHEKKHLFTHSGESPHKCVKCNRTFTTYFSMKRHMGTVHGDKQFTCNHCNMSFFSYSSLNQHVMYVHKNPVSYEEYILKIEDAVENGTETTMEIQYSCNLKDEEKSSTDGIILQPTALTNLSNMLMLSHLLDDSPFLS